MTKVLERYRLLIAYDAFCGTPDIWLVPQNLGLGHWGIILHMHIPPLCEERYNSDDQSLVRALILWQDQMSQLHVLRHALYRFRSFCHR